MKTVHLAHAETPYRVTAVGVTNERNVGEGEKFFEECVVVPKVDTPGYGGGLVPPWAVQPLLPRTVICCRPRHAIQDQTQCLIIWLRAAYQHLDLLAITPFQVDTRICRP
jgi:hypothetical protein